jgi:hypothetical protein
MASYSRNKAQMDRVKYDPNDDSKYWFARDKKRYQEYKLDRNKRKIAVKVEEYGMAATAGVALAAMASVGSLGGAAALGVGGAAVGYGVKKGIRGARALYHKGKAEKLRSLIERDDQNPGGRDPLAGWFGNLTLEDLNGLRFWIQKRRMSSWCYLSRSILYSLDRCLVARNDDQERRRRFCDAYRLANGELRFLLREVRAFNILMNDIEKKKLNKIFLPSWILLAFGENEPGNISRPHLGQINRCLQAVRKNLKKTVATDDGFNWTNDQYDQRIRALYEARQRRSGICGLDLLLFPMRENRRQRIREPGIGWDEEVSTVALEVLAELAFESVAAQGLGGLPGAIAEFGLAGAGIGFGFALMEATISILVELGNTNMEYGIMKRIGRLLRRCKVPPSPQSLLDFDESRQDPPEWVSKVDMGWYLEYMRMYVISLRTLLKDGGIFEGMIDTYVDLLKFADPRLEAKGTDIKTMDPRPFYDGDDRREQRINIVVESMVKRAQFLSMATLYNEYVGANWTLIKLVNWLHGRSQNPYDNINMNGLTYGESHLKSIIDWKNITPSSVTNYVREDRLMSRGAPARLRPPSQPERPFSGLEKKY